MWGWRVMTTGGCSADTTAMLPQAAKASGSLTLQKVLDMKEAGVDVDSFVSEELRLQMYTKEVAESLGSGTGDFDEQRLLHELPQALSLPEKRVKAAIEYVTVGSAIACGWVGHAF